MKRRTIGGTDNPAVLGAAKHRNNGRYNGNGREWQTPPELFATLDAEFHFTLDPCATVANAKCARYFTETENGLERSWGTERVFMNPPYGREVAAWTAKARHAAQQGALVVGLLPASTDLAWWHADVVGHAEVRYLRGRVRFLTGGPYRASGFFPSVVVIWRAPRETPEAKPLCFPDNPPDATADYGESEVYIEQCDRKLPLLGSNLDSPDPEAGAKDDHVG